MMVMERTDPDAKPANSSKPENFNADGEIFGRAAKKPSSPRETFSVRSYLVCLCNTCTLYLMHRLKINHSLSGLAQNHALCSPLTEIESGVTRVCNNIELESLIVGAILN